MTIQNTLIIPSEKAQEANDAFDRIISPHATNIIKNDSGAVYCIFFDSNEPIDRNLIANLYRNTEVRIIHKFNLGEEEHFESYQLSFDGRFIQCNSNVDIFFPKLST